MDGEKLCPLVRRPCDSDCAWFCDDCGECSIHLMAYALDALKDVEMSKRTHYE